MSTQQESRVKKTLLNARVNLIFYALSLFVSFFTRKIFLDQLGVDFVGLTTTLQNLLGFLNLAELGIGSAIGYVLYKPIFDKDESKLNEIISVFGYIYRWIGFAIIGGGVVLSLFLPLIFGDVTIDLSVVYYVYYSFLLSSLLGYFVNYKQTLLGADQKNYVVAGYLQTTVILKTILQAGLAYYTQNYYIWATNEIIFGVIFSVILNWRIAKTYPWLRSDIALGKGLVKKYPDIFKYTRQLFVHKMAAFVTMQTTPFLIYTYVSLSTVAIYGNYTIITTKLVALFSSLLDSGQAAIGNIIAEGDRRKVYNIFKELFAIRIFFTGYIIYILNYNIDAFISIWLGAEYIISSITLFLLLLTITLGLLGGLYGQFLFGFGLFYDTWAPIVESIIYIVAALVGGSFWGLNGVLLGSIISNLLINSVWKPYFLFSKGFNLPYYLYFVNIALGIGVFFASVSIARFVSVNYLHLNIFDNRLLEWVLDVSIESIIFLPILYVLIFVTNSGMRNLTRRVLIKIR